MKSGELYIVLGEVTVWATPSESLKTLGRLQLGSPVICLSAEIDAAAYCKVLTSRGLGWIHRSMLGEIT